MKVIIVEGQNECLGLSNKITCKGMIVVHADKVKSIESF